MLPRIPILNPLFTRPRRTFNSVHSTLFFRMSSSQQPPTNSNNDKNNNINHNDQNEEDSSSKPVLALPAPGDVASSTGGAPTLVVNGEDIKLDLLGPVVVNENGTLSRIDNWHEMSDIEKANVRRILLKRNEKRLASLRAERDEAIAAENAAKSNDK